ncbi:MAG: deoxyribonuclease IV [Chloroflexota bacterium]
MPQKDPEAPPVSVDPDEARAALTGRSIGPHLPLGQGMVKAVERARAIGATTIQVFSDNPTSWRRRTDPPAEIDRFRSALDRFGMGPLAIHASYLVNIASPEDELRARTVETMVAELRMGARYGARFVTLHLGSHRGTGVDAGLDRAGETLARVLDLVPPGPEVPLLVLEDSAGQGDTVGVTIAEVAGILAAAERHGADPARLAICLDTAHLWGAGVALDDPAEVDRLIREVDERIGLDRLAMLHLNDSRAGRGTRADRHEHLGAGGIGAAGLGALLGDPRIAHVPAYLETPGMESGWDAVNMERVRELLAGRPLAELPPGARAARGDRARAAR